MKQKKEKRYQVFFTIKGVVEVSAESAIEAETIVQDDPLGVAKGDYDFDTKVKEVKE